MRPSELNAIPPWDWPRDTGATLLRFLRDEDAESSERITAASMAGDLIVTDDEIALTLVIIARNKNETVDLRRSAAISLGPTLEDADTRFFEDGDEFDAFDEPAVSADVVTEIQKSLERLYLDADVPKDVRRAALEASVRAPQDWHETAVEEAIENEDRDWWLTGVFCARYIRGFDEQVLEALESDDPDIELEAVRAAGAWGIENAWPHVAALISRSEDKALRLAAIDAGPSIAREQASAMLADLVDPDGDEDIQEAVDEALVMCAHPDYVDELEDEDDEWLD